MMLHWTVAALLTMGSSVTSEFRLCSLRDQQLMDLSNNSFSKGQTAQILVEFLEVAITSIVYLKGLYPAGAFERRRYLNLVVHWHPALKEYIHSAVSSLRPFIQKGLIECGCGLLQQCERATGKMMPDDDAFESSLRSFQTKLQICQAWITALPKDCRWEITAYFRSLPEDGPSKEDDSPLWVATGTSLWQLPPLMTPIKSMSKGTLLLQLYLEHHGPPSQHSNADPMSRDDPING